MIAAIIVTYNPEQARLARLVDRCLPQVDAVIVVDNGSAAPVRDWLAPFPPERIHWIPLGANQGIAAAQNAGIARARALNADHVVLFDHDSVPEADMVAQLLAARRRQQALGVRVAAVGACYTDTRRDNPPPFTRIENWRLTRVGGESDPVAPVDYLIASGCLIPLTVLNDAGNMREDLFIDYVDVEWGLRAKARGYQSFGIYAARMEHRLGDETLTFWGRKMALHSPLRHYYMFRNAIWLYRQPYVPFQWACVDGARFIVRFFLYALFAKPRRKHIANMAQGIRDGFCSRLGKKRVSS